jgi:hypothetical protein
MRGRRGGAGLLVPAAPGQPGTAPPGSGSAPRPGAAAGAVASGADGDPRNIAETRRYLEDAAQLLSAKPDRAEFFNRMLKLYPERVNPFTLWLSATRLLNDEPA